MEITLSYLILIVVILIVIITLSGLIFWFKKKVNKNLELETLLIKIPKYTKREQEELSKEYIVDNLSKVENLFVALAGLKADKGLKQREDVLSLEIVSQEGMIYFYAAVPKQYKEYFVQQIQAVYPKVYFETIEDYNIFQSNSAIKVGALRFANDISLPIKTFQSFANDPLESITNALSKLEKDESAAIQYVFRSAPKKWHARARKIIQNMNQGMSLDSAIGKIKGTGVLKILGSIINFVINLFSTSKNKDEDKPLAQMPDKHQASAMEQEASKMLEQKTSKPGLDVNIRVIVASKTNERSESVLQDLLNSYTQYNIYEFGNSFKAVMPKKIDKLVNQFIYRQFVDNLRLLLNAEEMASVIHLPLPTTETPNIAWLEAVKAPPPSNMPAEGLILGKNIYRGKENLVRIKPEDRRRHMYIIGQTGTGKSVLQESLIIQDIKAGHGVCVVDPHGDLIETALTHVPKNRAEDVILFDPSQTSRPLGMNMLEFETEEQKTFVINEMIAIFDKLYDLKATGGPMFEQYMRNAMLLVMDDPASGATLLEIPRVLADAEYRKSKLATVQNRFVKDFWEKEAQKAGGEASLANMVPYITSKLTPFVSNDLIRPIISQSKSAFNFREAMDNNKIILINLSKGKIGEMNSSLLGMIIIGKLLYAAMSRVDIAEDKRNDFYLYIDEFQNFITDTISVILSEARKYRLNLSLAHQFIAQLVKSGDTKVRDAIFGNVGTLVSFRIGVEDAEVVAKQMAPVVSEYDLVNMPKYTCYTRLLIDNAAPPAFSFNPIKPEKGNFELAEALKELSALKYGRDRQQIEDEASQRIVI
jgi:hypothetical protein